MTVEDVQNALQKVAQHFRSRVEVDNVLQKFGVTGITELDPSKYAELVADAEALVK
jgi:hypothetical protein